MNKAEPTLALKPGGDVTRNPKQGCQWPHKRTIVRQKYKNRSVTNFFLKKKVKVGKFRGVGSCNHFKQGFRVSHGQSPAKTLALNLLSKIPHTHAHTLNPRHIYINDVTQMCFRSLTSFRSTFSNKTVVCTSTKLKVASTGSRNLVVLVVQVQYKTVRYIQCQTVVGLGFHRRQGLCLLKRNLGFRKCWKKT